MARGTASGLGTSEEPWNCPKGKWNARSASGTAFGLRPPARLSAALVLFVGRRYYLRPISAVPTSGTPEGLSAATRVRVCDGNAMSV